MLQLSSHISCDKARFKKVFKHCAHSKAVTLINKEENSQFPRSRHLRNGYTNKNTPRIVQGAAFNVTHFDLAIVLVWVVGGVADNVGWVPCGLGFCEQWNVGSCSSAYFEWNSSC